jgi:hypothetical protein
MKQRGLMLQMDGSTHRWFGSKKSCLVIVIDDADGDILHGEFTPTETTFACMNVVKTVLKNHGTFQVLYTDRAGIFGKNPTNHLNGMKRDGFSALKYCLSEFGVHIVYAHSPEAKGRVERAFKTLQDRLIAELRLNDIYTLHAATKYFNDVYLPRHRELFVKEAVVKESAFIPLLHQHLIDEKFFMRVRRTVKNDQTFSYEGEQYDINVVAGQNYSGKEIELRFYPDGKVRYFIDDKEIDLKQEFKAVS